ncbi:CpaD family pilus assembly lipoprotein [Vibrio lentus]|nr:CpaD family pilus assembly lipoprotein [Vibrio lentus]
MFAESYRAKVTACDAGKTPRTTLNAYRTQRNFGCANANALAQMVANPKDLDCWSTHRQCTRTKSGV